MMMINDNDHHDVVLEESETRRKKKHVSFHGDNSPWPCQVNGKWKTAPVCLTATKSNLFYSLNTRTTNTREWVVRSRATSVTKRALHSAHYFNVIYALL